MGIGTKQGYCGCGWIGEAAQAMPNGMLACPECHQMLACESEDGGEHAASEMVGNSPVCKRHKREVEQLRSW
jgi:hypothetical protein